MINRYSFYHLKLVTSLFGFYLFFHFYYLLFYAQELFSNSGMLLAHLSPAYGYFPNILNILPETYLATLFVGLLTTLSLFVIAGTERKWIYLLLWFGWACLLTRNPLIRNPGLPYVGWLLLAFAVIYPIKDQIEFRLNKWIYDCAWSLLAVGYTLSGLDKLQATSWLDGTAIHHLLVNPLARDYWPTHILAEMKWTHPVMTYTSLALEVLFLPLALFRKTRPWIWLALIGMQVGILFVVDFADLTFGMLMIHLFTFNPDWISNRIKPEAILFFDGVCGLCSRAVDFLMIEDHSQNLKYAPLQGSTFEKFNNNLITIQTSSQDMQTLYVWTGEKLLKKSEAWMWLLLKLGGIWTVAYWVLRIFPISFLDFVYDLVARHRYKFFGKSETCRLPTPAERKRFLD